VAFLALLAERKINNLRVINIPWSSIPSLATISLKISFAEVLRYAQDFGCWLPLRSRHQTASSSIPSLATTLFNI
jgi:hypothetical protein